MNKNNTGYSLFTPGPLNTSVSVKKAMNVDLGSRTKDCTNLTIEIQEKLCSIADTDDFSPVLMQGSGTFAVEAMLSSLIAEEDTVIIINNGTYGQRMVDICKIHEINYKELKCKEQIAVDVDEINSIITNNPSVSHIALVHFETNLGVLNQLNSLLSICEEKGIRVLTDAMSSFGALPINFKSKALVAVAASANKCLHGVPGLGFVFVRKDELSKKPYKRTLSLDLRLQYISLKETNQWRFTPPIQVMLAFSKALDEFIMSGGRQSRLNKYESLMKEMTHNLRSLNIFPYIEEKYRAPMIVTFNIPKGVTFEYLYDCLIEKNIVIYPSSVKGCFRLGAIGEINSEDVNRLISNLRTILTKE